MNNNIVILNDVAPSKFHKSLNTIEGKVLSCRLCNDN